MPVLRFMTAGESHGSMLVGILDGLPAGMELGEQHLLGRLARRQGGYGRGKRMSIESDQPQIVSGLWQGKTSGSPLAVLIANRSNRQDRTQKRRTVPRAGHADLAGLIKYGFDDTNPVIERASARETTMRVALGSVACRLLECCGARLTGHVIEFGGVVAPALPADADPDWIETRRDRSEVACCDADGTRQMVARVDEAAERGETLGGRVELIVWGLPIGLGSYVQSDRKLDGRLAGALMSIPSVKEVEIGDALAIAKNFGRSAHDVIVRENEQLTRRTNRAGGLEGGVTNGMPLVVRMTLKPISTQRKPLPSIDLDSGETVEGKYIRSDIAVVPAAAVIAEAMAGLVLADALLEKFGADRLDDLQAAIERHWLRAQQVGRPKGRS